MLAPDTYFKLAFFLTPQPQKIYNLLRGEIKPAATKNIQIGFRGSHVKNRERFLISQHLHYNLIQRFFHLSTPDILLQRFVNILNLPELIDFVEKFSDISLSERKILIKYILQSVPALEGVDVGVGVDSAPINDIFLMMNPNYLLNNMQLEKLINSTQRMADDYPLAYITGTQSFYGIDLKVNSDVLIPRPETELLVSKALELIAKRIHAKPLKILELGTGSGAISIALFKNLIKTIKSTDFQITALDICPQALKIAKENAQNHDANVAFLESDWFKNLSTQVNVNHNLGDMRFDLIITNPPYISAVDPHLKGSIRFEPLHALTDLPALAQNSSAVINSDLQGLMHIEHIINEAKNFLKPNAFLLIEHGYDQSAAIQKIFSRTGYENISTEKDLQEQDRYSFASPIKK